MNTTCLGILANKQLEGKDEFSYCPYCVKEFKEKNKGTTKVYKDFLQPLTYIKKYMGYTDKEGKQQKYTEEYWTCKTCKRSVTDKDYLICYCVDSNGERYTEEKLNKRLNDPGAQK